MTGLSDWKYYNRAAIPAIEPKQFVDIKPLEDGSIWNIDGNKPLFTRYTTDFDCGYETEWWHIIKDNVYDIDSIDRKKRWYIRKSRELFNVQKINPIEYAEDLGEVCDDAFKAYPSDYRPNFDKAAYVTTIKNGSLSNLDVLGAFDYSNGKIGGFLVYSCKNNCIELVQLKTNREAERNKVNFALIDKFLTLCDDLLRDSKHYVYNNERNIVHETNFPEFLIKYFGFRKAYCHLHMVYRPSVSIYIYILYLFRHYIKSISHKHPFLYKISAVLEMECIARKCRSLK